MNVRTVAAIIVWIVVALLLFNRLLVSDLVFIISIILTFIAILIFFSPRILKKKTS